MPQPSGLADELRARIAELQAEQAQYYTEATARLVAYSATIGELQTWFARLEAETHPQEGVITNGVDA